jgi:3-deoxy-D-manno-octulosonic-acid transferase
MFFLYTLSILLYRLLIWPVSFFNEKAKKWLDGRKNIFTNIESALQNNQNPIIWFHVASLGEFEQARPIIEKLNLQNQTAKLDSSANKTRYSILITFFSPSGYEVRKNYESADYIFYLPLDTPQNARKFLDIVQPKAVFWVKYEFWFNYLREIQKRKIPIILFSANFRPNQLFFQWYGQVFLNILKGFTQIFVQNEVSYNLLKINKLNNIQIAGDTRFDRVRATALAKQTFPLIATFKNQKKLLVIGSSWEDDLAVILPFFNTFSGELKIIIAPHEIKENKLQSIENQILKKSIRYSNIAKIPEIELKESEVLLIDNVGMLASLYQYGEFAYVGGAFKQGLHNILEPATFGLPIIFGPIIRKYPEALDLISLGGAFSIKSSSEFGLIFSQLYENENKRLEAGAVSLQYISDNVGGAEKIWRYFTEMSI